MTPLRRATALGQALALVWLGVAGCATGTTESPAPAAISSNDADTIDRLFGDYTGHDVPGAAVLVVKDGQVAFIRGYGMADVETKAEVTERTNFRLASLTKAFTAMAIMMLVNEGQLHFEQRVHDLLPGFPAYGRDIRIRQLLNHTSGLRAYQDLVPHSFREPLKDRDVVALLRRTDTTYFPPGSAFRYGDTGYALLALVVETVSGEPFARFLRDRIFTPIGMKTTVAYEPGVSDVPRRAIGYAPAPNGFRPAGPTLASAVLGDGGIYSSVRDLAAWDRALDTHALVEPWLQQEAWTPGVLSDGRRTRYGFGWFLERDGASPATSGHVWHHGDTSGFSHFIVKYPERNITVVVLTNRRGGTPDKIATTIAALPSLQGQR